MKNKSNQAKREIRKSRRYDYLWREIVFRLVCRHQQCDKPNLLIYCSRRGGSTWLLNALAAHAGMRYVNRPLMSALWSRHRRHMPDLAAQFVGELPSDLNHLISFNPAEEQSLKAFVGKVFAGDVEVYPSLNFKAPYFRRKTNRIAFQMTSGTPLIEWFDEAFDVNTLIFLRHPIPTALSIIRAGWQPECHEFIFNQKFSTTFLNEDLVDYAKHIMKSGSLLERHVLDWTLKMLAPFKSFIQKDHFYWTLFTYEQTVLEPRHVVEELCKRYQFEVPEQIIDQLSKPSRTVSLDTADRVQDTNYLLNRWRETVSRREESQLMTIPLKFGIDVYTPHDDHRDSKYSI